MPEYVTTEKERGRFAAQGGRFALAQWMDFLRAWRWPDGEARWAAWEFIDGFILNTGELPAADRMGLLERVELFGASGHVSARRDEETVHWHFVGDPSVSAPGQYAGPGYDVTHPGDTFNRVPLDALLWGERKDGLDRWHEDRVARAILKYPDVTARRARARGWQFTTGGQVAFVWLTGLSDDGQEG